MTGFSSVHIYYFSGTGNSKNVALWFAQTSEKNGCSCTLHNIAEIDRKAIPPPDDQSLLVFISPVHGFNYPPIMLYFLLRFPRGRNKVVLMNTRAGMLIGKWITPGLSGITFYLASLILLLKGFSIRGLVPVNLPSNWISVHPGLNARTIQYLHEQCRERVLKAAKIFISGGRNFNSIIEIIQDLLIAPVAVLYYIIGRFFLAKTYYASGDCNDCEACVKGCPVHAIIKVGNKPFWTFHCESCMKCMSLCPKKSIETAHGFTALFTWLFYSLFLGAFYAYGAKLGLPVYHPVVQTILEPVLLLSLFAAAYRMLYLLMKIRLVERITVYTSLTKYRFWGRRYRALKDKK